jgi:DNA-binding MarR family transcriptional regulator
MPLAVDRCVRSERVRLAGTGDGSGSRWEDACVASALRMLARLVGRDLNRLLATHGMSFTEFQLTALLGGGALSGVELARRLRLDPAPVNRALGRLRDRGMVERLGVRRMARWALTPEAVAGLEVLEPLWEAVNARTQSTLGADLIRAVVRQVDDWLALPPRPHGQVGWFDD